MVFISKVKSGMITVEVAVSLLSVIVFLFIMVGVLNENLDKIAANTFKKSAVETDGRKNYQSYGRDYTDSTVYVK